MMASGQPLTSTYSKPRNGASVLAMRKVRAAGVDTGQIRLAKRRNKIERTIAMTRSRNPQVRNVMKTANPAIAAF